MTILRASDGLLPGFTDPVMQSQKIFRLLLEAMARPGTMVELPLSVTAPAPLDPATAAAALTLLDYETPLWLDETAGTEAVASYLRFHCGCPLVHHRDRAAFAIIADPARLPPLASFNLGSDEYPDRSTTLIIQVPSLTTGDALALSGPGIRDSITLAASGFPKEFRQWMADNHELFPRGVDIFFTCGTLIAGLPRSTRLGA